MSSGPSRDALISRQAAIYRLMRSWFERHLRGNVFSAVENRGRGRGGLMQVTPLVARPGKRDRLQEYENKLAERRRILARPGAKHPGRVLVSGRTVAKSPALPAETAMTRPVNAGPPSGGMAKGQGSKKISKPSLFRVSVSRQRKAVLLDPGPISH
jgi:hypothetical protein